MSAFYWSPGMTIKSMEEVFVAEAIHFYADNKQSAANSLGITLEQLQVILNRSTLEKEAQDKADVERKKKEVDFLARSRGMIGIDKTGHDTLSAYVPKEGLDSVEAATILANTAPQLNTPENAIPVASVLPNAGDLNPSGDPLAAAKRTKELMDQNLPLAGDTFPAE